MTPSSPVAANFCSPRKCPREGVDHAHISVSVRYSVGFDQLPGASQRYIDGTVYREAVLSDKHAFRADDLDQGAVGCAGSCGDVCIAA